MNKKYRFNNKIIIYKKDAIYKSFLAKVAYFGFGKLNLYHKANFNTSQPGIERLE